jgi:hypothetical protein
MAEERPRTYGALMLVLGGAALLFMRGHAMLLGRISIVLTLLVPFLLVFGTQALVLGTTPSSLRTDRTTAIVMFALSALGSVVLWRWLAA